MSRRDALTAEVVTAGNPTRALLAAISESAPTDGGVYRLKIAHDDGCPCVTAGSPLHACTCEIIWLKRERVQ